MSWMAACPRSSSSSPRFRTATNLTPQFPQAVASSATGASHIGQGTVDTAPFVSGSSTWSARRRLCRARSASPRRACSFVFRTQSPGYAGSSSASRSRDCSAARGSSRVAWAAAIANKASESFGFILSRSLAICMMRECRRARSSWDSRTAPSAGSTEEVADGLGVSRTNRIQDSVTSRNRYVGSDRQSLRSLLPIDRVLHSEGEPPRALLLGFEDRAVGRDVGGGSRGLGRLEDDQHPGFRHLEDPERRVRRGVLEVKDADLPEDPIARPDALHLDDAVEWLEERRDLGPGVHVLLQEDEAREPVAVELLLCALRERIDLGDLVRVHRGREHFDHGAAGRVRWEGGDRATQGHAEVREIDRGADHDAFLFDVEDRFFTPGVPVHDPQAILGRDRVQVHAESAKVRDDRVGRLARDDHESASARLEAFREEREGEAALLLARRALEDDARSDGEAALDHGVETLNARGQPRHAITIPKVG